MKDSQAQPQPDSGRERLLRVAEKLFGERGIHVRWVGEGLIKGRELSQTTSLLRGGGDPGEVECMNESQGTIHA